MYQFLTDLVVTGEISKVLEYHRIPRESAINILYALAESLEQLKTEAVIIEEESIGRCD